jgi:hypothetical protein
MLNGYDRLLLTQAIVPPSGYALDEALGTTYSLDLLALVSVSLAASGVDAEILEKPEPGDALVLLEAVRRNICRFTICCQSGAIHVPREFKDVFLWLEPSVSLKFLRHTKTGCFIQRFGYCASLQILALFATAFYV